MNKVELNWTGTDSIALIGSVCNARGCYSLIESIHAIGIPYNAAVGWLQLVCCPWPAPNSPPNKNEDHSNYSRNKSEDIFVGDP